MAKQLNPGEMKELVFDQRKIDTGDKQVIIAQLVKEPTLTEKFEREVANIGRDKVVQFPFEAHREGNDKVVISGVIDQENVKRAKKDGKKLKVVRNFVARKIEKWKEEVERLGEREYYLKYDRDGNEYAWVKLPDGNIGTFLNPERTFIQIGDHAYHFDGTIRYDEEIDLFPHR